METSSQRRKACDLCFIKKIKCDMLKPACSNCLLYKSECRTTTVRRRAPHPKERPQPPKQSESENPTKVSELESRLASIEKQLQQALDANRQHSNLTSTQPSTAPSSTESINGGGESAESIEFVDHVSSSESPSEWVTEPEKPKLPPLEEIMPVIDEFFNRYNCVMPLFDPPTFMRMLSNWYVPSSGQSTAVWAAVNIAMALGYRCTLKEQGNLDALVDDQKVMYHMRNVQSVVSDLVTREEDLLGLQVLLGMVVLFLGTKDPKPASVLIGTAVRLAHRMHLHDKESLQYFSPEVARQRARLFWITYIMDKEISLKSKTPSFQLDVDIDLPLPERNPEDGAGIMFARNGSKFNYFRARVELSHIAGKVYDQLYSTRARKVSPQDRQLRVTRLEEMLENWRRNLPPEFQIDSALQCLDSLPIVHMSLLYHGYFTAMVMTHGIYSHDADWVRQISSYSQMTIKDLDSSPNSSCGRQNPPLPLGWAKCAELSRSCMKLFVESPKSDCSIWSNSCAHFSGLIILLANMFVFPDHPHLMTDNELANQALRLFELMLSMKSYEDYESFHRLHEVVKELHRRALEAVEEVTRKQKEQAEAAAAAAASAMDTGLPFGAQLEDEVEFFRDAEAAALEGPFVGTFVSASPFATTSWGLEGLQSENSKPSSDRKHVTSRSLVQSASQISLPTLLMRVPRPLYRQSTISNLLRKPIQTRSFSQSVKDMADYKLKAVSSLSLRPGDKQEVEVEGIEGAKVLLVNAGGKIQAVGPKCTHFGAPLVKGVLTTSGRLTCPWHGACFNTKTGDVEDAPALDSIPVFNVTERDGAVYITGEESAIKSGRRKPNFKCNVVSGTQEEKVVIVGGGSGALGAVEALRNGGYQGPLTIISSEGYLPIDRTKLSKALLTDVNALQWRDKAWYESGSVDWVDDQVTDVDFSDRKVSTSGGKTLPYTKLILATGGTPRNLPLQGFKVLGNIFTLRTAHDTQKIVKAIGEKGKKIVIVGSSFIGMEVANATAKDNSVTVIGMEKVPLERVLGEQVGAGIQKSLEKNGVKFHMNAGVEKAEPSASDPSNVGAVHLKDGTKLEADLVILGVGVAPATEFLKENKVIRLEQDGSIKTDENFLVVGLKDVYAIGDIATYPYHGPGGDGRYTRIEHWNVAQNAGRTVASNIINAAVQPARFIPVFWSALGSQLRYCGNTIGGWDDVVIQGSVEESSFVAYYTKGDTVVAMASMGKDPAMVQSAELMVLGKMPSKKQLADGLDITTIGPLEA
ncbi:nadh oxidase [Colletotrichum camelliae]|nr:nadh oxidase [Colletotrichum camelliae]